MTKKLTLYLFLLICSTGIFAQDEAMIGSESDSDSTQSVPINVGYTMSWTATIYTKNEINTGGISKAKDIKYLSYYVTNTPKNCGKPFKIYIRETDKSQYDFVNNDKNEMPTGSGFVEVYNGNVSWKKGWNTIKFSKSFSFTNTKNIEIFVKDDVNDGDCNKWSSTTNNPIFKAKRWTNPSSCSYNYTCHSRAIYGYTFSGSSINTRGNTRPNRPIIKLSVTNSSSSSSSGSSSSGSTSRTTNPASNEVTVGESLRCGTSGTSYAPAKYDYVLNKTNSWVHMLYTASRIKASGEIKGIAFFVDCIVTDPCNFSEAKNQKIYIKEVDEEQFSNANEPDLSTYTKVYDGGITWKRGKIGNVENSKTQIPFDTPFTYSGEKSLAIYFLNENNKKLEGSSFFCTGSPTFLWDYAGEKTIVYENFVKGSKTGTGRLDKMLPIIRLYFDKINIENNTPDVSKTTITASPQEIKANGVSSSTITVQLYNAKGEKLKFSGQNVSLTTTAGTLNNGGKAVYKGNGTYTAFLTSSEDEETATISGTLNGAKIEKTATVKFVKGTPNPDPDPDPEKPEETKKLIQAFSPNGDGTNDVWKILPNIETEYPNNSLQVFNRLGNLVYKAAPYKNDWDGTSDGKITVSKDSKLPIGSYYYIFNTGKDKTYKGWVYINY